MASPGGPPATTAAPGENMPPIKGLARQTSPVPSGVGAKKFAEKIFSVRSRGGRLSQPHQKKRLKSALII
jgi:hypothetical protein